MYMYLLYKFLKCIQNIAYDCLLFPAKTGLFLVKLWSRRVYSGQAVFNSCQGVIISCQILLIFLSRSALIKKYTTQTLISIKSLFLITGHIGNLTHEILLQIYSSTITVQIFHHFFVLPASPSRRLAGTMETPGTEVVTAAYPIQFCHSSPLTGSFNCKTVLIIEMSILLCLKSTFGKFQKSVIFG